MGSPVLWGIVVAVLLGLILPLSILVPASILSVLCGIILILTGIRDFDGILPSVGISLIVASFMLVPMQLIVMSLGF